MAASLICVFVLTTSSSAFALPRLLAPVPDDRLKPFSNALIRSVQKEIRSNPRIESVNQAALRDYIEAQAQTSQNTTNPEEVSEKANQLLDQGWKDYKGLDLANAEKKLQQAKSLFRDLLAIRPDFRKLLTSYLHLGIIYLAKNDKERGEREIQEMVILDPKRASRKLSPKYYNPSVIETYNKIRSNVLVQDKATIELKIQPTNASVWMDGAPINGTAASDVPVGEHVFTARASGYDDFFTTKYIVAGDNSFQIELTPQSVPLDPEKMFSPIKEISEMEHSRIRGLDEVSVATDADILVFYRVIYDAKATPLAVIGQLYDQRNQELSKQVKEPVIDAKKTDVLAAKLFKKLLKSINSKGYVSPPTTESGKSTELNTTLDNSRQPISGSSPKTLEDQLLGSQETATVENSRPWYRRWWFYAILGGAVAGAGVLAASGALSDASSNNIIIDNPEN